MDTEARQKPVANRNASTYAEMLAIVEHPAFRIGFLDAMNGADFNHDDIMSRIMAETPPRALQRIGWGWSVKHEETPLLPGFMAERMAKNRKAAVELAQYRYEEGRYLQKLTGMKCRAWGHPDYPPKAVVDYILARSREAAA